MNTEEPTNPIIEHEKMAQYQKGYGDAQFGRAFGTNNHGGDNSPDLADAYKEGYEDGRHKRPNKGTVLQFRGAIQK